MAAPKDIQIRYRKLKAAINHYRTLYHVWDKEEISDAANDALKHELEEIEKEYPEAYRPRLPKSAGGGQALAAV